MVPSAEAKDRLEQIAEIWGIAAVDVTGVTVDPDSVDESQAAIRRSAYLDRRDIRVHCQLAHVSLYGIVESDLEKQVAEWIADSVTGVVHANHSLAVEPQWKEKSDAAIKSDLQRKLKYALLDRSDNMDVTVENGTVILKGEVATWRQWQLVMDLALEAGARHPRNLLNVGYHPPHGASRIFVPR